MVIEEMLQWSCYSMLVGEGVEPLKMTEDLNVGNLFVTLTLRKHFWRGLVE